MSEFILITVITFAIVWLVITAHYSGYKKGYDKGFNSGKQAINEYVVKINHALGERIEEMNRRK